MMNIFNKISPTSQSVFFKNVNSYFGNRIIDILPIFVSEGKNKIEPIRSDLRL